MKMKLKKEDIKRYFLKLEEKFEKEEGRLCQLDSAVGDGDHGTSMAKGMREISKELADEEPEDMSSIFETASQTFTSQVGGSIGPLFGTIFREFSNTTEGLSQIDLKTAEEMFQRATKQVKVIGGVERGEKTLLDALGPAADALTEVRESGLTLKKGLEKATSAAKQGVKDSQDMVGSKGRAKYMNEESRGHKDPGAVSVYLIIESLSNL